MKQKLEEELSNISKTFGSFTTNQGDNTLKNKLLDISKDINIKHLDIVVAFFRMSGFDQIKELFENKTIRLLIGINTEKKVKTAIDIFSDNLVETIQKQIDKKNKLNIELLINLLEIKQLQIKAVELNNNHSKIYIYTDIKKINGGVIIGSSNLTYSGIIGNFETNIIEKNDIYIKEATQIFEVLWKYADELSDKDIDDKIIKKLKNYSPEIIEITKYNNIFYKTLIEYFDTIIDNDLDIKSNIKLFTYQKDAVSSAIFRINKYNGVILGDVVGLGKTIIAIAILQKLNKKSLIVAPPAIHKQWIETLKEFNINNYELVTFDKIPEMNNSKIIVIDESHKLKNHNSKRYQNIEEICKIPFRKQVILLTATLQNNSPLDIANQIYLFQDKNNSNLPNIVSLEKFFNPLISEFKQLKENDNTDEVTSILYDISQKIKNNVLKHILIRRTRTDIKSFDMYSSDIKAFPTIEKLNNLSFNLGGLSDKYKTTINYLENRLKYNRFKALNNLNDNGKSKYKNNNPHIISDNIFKDNDLSTLAKYSFIKRFDSSFKAFYISLINSITTLEYFIEALKNNKLYIGENSTKVLNKKTTKIQYNYDGDKVYYTKKIKGNLIKVYLKGTVFKQSNFANSKKYIDDLEKELKILNKLKDIWKDNKLDPKIELFKNELVKLNNKKAVIFTEYKDTLEYLKDNLPTEIKIKTLFVTSQNRDELSQKIAKNFDANYSPELQENKYQFIITTDTLAEGVNLHRSDTLFNYDLPWNSTKLMQRMGRINRIGSEFDTLDIHNFKPVDKSNKIIGILEKSFLKLQSFHYTLGEDSKILFDEEVVESFGIDEEIDEELKYLEIIRDFKKENLTLFNNLKKQKNISTQVITNNNIDTQLSFFKLNDISYMYQYDKNMYKNIDFLTFIKYIEDIKKEEKTISKIDETIDYHIMKMNTDSFTKNDLKKSLTKADKNAIFLLQKWLQIDKIINRDIYIDISSLIEAKTISNLSKKILDLKLKENDEIIKELDKLKDLNIKIEVIDSEKVEKKIFINIENKKD